MFLPLNLQILMIDNSNIEALEGSLALACANWQPLMHRAQQHMQTGESEQAIECASEAIRLSAAVHPRYHFLESGLHTALAALHLKDGDEIEATRHFERAVFMHHDNPTALAGLEAMKQKGGVPRLPLYTHEMVWEEWAAFCGAEHSIPRSGIFELKAKAQEAQGPTQYEFYAQAIAHCDATHRQYHVLAAETWWLRAQLHYQSGEIMLAINDLTRGLDLDRANTWARERIKEWQAEASV